MPEIIAGKHFRESEVVTQENGRFYFNLAAGRFNAHLVAEGHRKLATLLYLLRNG